MRVFFKCLVIGFVFVIVFVFVFVIVFFGVRSCLIITLIKCLEGHKSLGSLSKVTSFQDHSLLFESDGRTLVGIELSQTKSGQLKKENP